MDNLIEHLEENTNFIDLHINCLDNSEIINIKSYLDTEDILDDTCDMPIVNYKDCYNAHRLLLKMLEPIQVTLDMQCDLEDVLIDGSITNMGELI